MVHGNYVRLVACLQSPDAREPSPSRVRPARKVDQGQHVASRRGPALPSPADAAAAGPAAGRRTYPRSRFSARESIPNPTRTHASSRRGGPPTGEGWSAVVPRQEVTGPPRPASRSRAAATASGGRLVRSTSHCSGAVQRRCPAWPTCRPPTTDPADWQNTLGTTEQIRVSLHAGRRGPQHFLFVEHVHVVVHGDG